MKNTSTSTRSSRSLNILINTIENVRFCGDVLACFDHGQLMLSERVDVRGDRSDAVLRWLALEATNFAGCDVDIDQAIGLVVWEDDASWLAWRPGQPAPQPIRLSMLVDEVTCAVVP